MADYTLPDLPYGYVIDQLAQARSTNDFGAIVGLEKRLASVSAAIAVQVCGDPGHHR